MTFPLGLMALAVGACAPESRAPDEPLALAWDTASLWIGPAVTANTDTLPLFNPSSLQWLGGSIVIVEPGGGGVGLFDSLFTVRREIGRAGQGPGEYRRPLKASGAWPYLAVSDHGNQRRGRLIC